MNSSRPSSSSSSTNIPNTQPFLFFTPSNLQIGPQGPIGGIGFQGPIGPQGLQGISAQIGFQGPQGFQGIVGITGPQGIIGPQGFQGIAAEIGFQGPQGFQGVQGLQGPQGIIGFQGAIGFQGFQGPDILPVANTAFVDNVFPSATPAVEDAENPFDTIGSALLAVAAARLSPTDRWRIVVRPGIYDEGGFGNTINTLPFVDIQGSGDSTIINATFINNVGSGPSTVSNVFVNVPSKVNVIIEDTFTVENSKFFFTPVSSEIGDAFRLTGKGSPNFTMFHSFISIQPIDPLTTGVGFFQIAAMQGESVTVNVSEVTGIENGLAAGVIGFDSISGIISVSIRNSTFDMTVQNTPPDVFMFCYGGQGIIRTATDIDVRWLIDDCNHIFRNGVPNVAPTNPYIISLLNGFTFTPLSSSLFLLRDSLFQFIDFPINSQIYSGSDTITDGNFMQYLDNKWEGLSLGKGIASPFVPPRKTTVPFLSVPIVYNDITSRGSSVFSGGLQTGTTNLGSGLISYTVIDPDAIIIWAPNSLATLVLPNAVQPPSASYIVYIGKWLSVYNSNKVGGSNITISCSGPANGVTVKPQSTVLFQNIDGTNWIVAAGGPASPGTLVQSSSGTSPIIVGGSITATASAPIGSALSGGGFTFSNPTANSIWSVVQNGPNGVVGSPTSNWTVTLQNTGSVPIIGAILTVSAIAY